VTSAFPASLRAAVGRGLLLFAGGSLQLLLSSLLLQHFQNLRIRLIELTHRFREEETALRTALIETAQSARQLRFLDSALPYSLQLAFAIALATEIYRRLRYPRTALLVLKPALTDTVSRAIARTLGTMCAVLSPSAFSSPIYLQRRSCSPVLLPSLRGLHTGSSTCIAPGAVGGQRIENVLAARKGGG
jgi:hypothetical protein